MSNAAASGGYYIAMACDTIIAHHNTITGSIGVVGALPNLSNTLKKLNITYDTISTGIGNSYPLDPFIPMKQKDVATLNKLINKTYHRFVSKVAESRNMSYETAKSLAKGRI